MRTNIQYFLLQRKMMGSGEYVCGLEPGNCLVMGRAEERAAGRLKFIAPGEEQIFRVSVRVLEGGAALAQAESRLQNIAP